MAQFVIETEIPDEHMEVLLQTLRDFDRTHGGCTFKISGTVNRPASAMRETLLRILGADAKIIKIQPEGFEYE